MDENEDVMDEEERTGRIGEDPTDRWPSDTGPPPTRPLGTN
jgi:hypothetical protein